MMTNGRRCNEIIALICSNNVTSTTTELVAMT